jgi:hypothetical protein
MYGLPDSFKCSLPFKVFNVPITFTESGILLNPLSASTTADNFDLAIAFAFGIHPMVIGGHYLLTAVQSNSNLTSVQSLEVYLDATMPIYLKFFMSLPIEACQIVETLASEVYRHKALGRFRDSVYRLKPRTTALRFRPGYVYLIKSTSGHYKIGRTKSPKDRMATFGTKLPFEVEYEHLIECNDMYEIESELHARYASRRVNGEWFDLTEDHVKWIKSLGDKVGRWLGEAYIEHPAA